jgi:tRNA (uracil-5-)-methyltransferase
LIPKVQQHLYQQFFQEKIAYLSELFASNLENQTSPVTIEAFSSPDIHYRMRCEFRIWHEGDDFDYVMFEADAQNPKQQNRIPIHQYEIASQRINQAMQLLKTMLHGKDVLKRKLFQVEFLDSLHHQLLITLIYHKTLDDRWESLAKDLEKELNLSFQAQGSKVFVMGRAHKQRIVLSQDFVTEILEVEDRKITYEQPEGAFSQPNAIVCQKMLTWACQVSKRFIPASNTQDLVELYCGHGTFSLALAPCFRRVLGTEIASSSVRTAQKNIAINQIQNVVIARLSSEEFALALAGKMDDSRRVQALTLSDYSFSTILVDPPRAGLDPASLEQCASYDHMIYISCQPSTLKRDLDQLCQSHEIKAFAMFDQFPYTHHIESGVFLTKKSSIN